MSFHTLAAAPSTPPTVTAGPIEQGVGLDRATIYWQTDQATDAEVTYYPTADPAESFIETRGTPDTEHNLVLTNLSPDTEYTYAVRSMNGGGLVSGPNGGTFMTTDMADVTAPAFQGQPSVADLQFNRARIQWRTSEPADAEVRFTGPDGIEQSVVNAVDLFDHDLALTNLEGDATYSFQAFSTDAAGNGPVASLALSFTTPAEPDLTPPEFIGGIAILDVGYDRATVAATTSEATTAVLEYGLTAGYELGNLPRADLVPSHEWQLVGLAPAATYHVRVCATDGVGNGPACSGDVTVNTEMEPDAAPPLISSGPLAVSTTHNEAVIEVTLDEPAQLRLTHHLAGVSETVPLASYLDFHRVVLSNLELDSDYTYELELEDAAGNTTVRTGFSFSTEGAPDEEAPKIDTGPTVYGKSDTEATIAWTTDESASTIIDYGLNAQYGVHIDRGGLQQQHSFTVSNLNRSTTYHFKVSGRDLAGNEFSTDPAGTELHSVDHAFTTLAEPDETPPMFRPRPNLVWTNQTAVIFWGTDEPATSRVDYIRVSQNEQPQFEEINALAQNHSITLTNLVPRSYYQFRITSVDQAGNVAIAGASRVLNKPLTEAAAKLLQVSGGEGIFVTEVNPDMTAPAITAGPWISERTNQSLTIMWETDELADSFVRFGSTEAVDRSVGSARDVRQHRVTLTNLVPGQKCFYRVESTDPSDNGPSLSPLAIAATAAEVDLSPPRFESEPQVVARTDAEVVVGWHTDEAAAARIEYESGGETLTSQVDQRRADQQVVLNHLQADTEYALRIFVSDASRNETQDPFVLRLVTDRGPDLELPRILSGPDMVALTDQSATLTWRTDELADSHVELGPSPYLGTVVGSLSDRLDHRVIITNLDPSTTYYYRVGSTDRSENGPVLSSVSTFTTLGEPDQTPPLAPEGLVVFPGSGENLLEWTMNGEADLGGYTIYRDDDGSFAPIATQVQENRFLDQGLEDGRLYRYQVTAVDREAVPNESLASEISSGTPDPDNVPRAPAILGLEQGATASRPILVIQNAESVEMGEPLTYTVQISTSSAFADVVGRGGNIDEGFGLTRWRVSRELVTSRFYWWRVRATDGRFTGPWSEPLRLRPRQATVPALASRDFNGDGNVSFADFFIFASGFGSADPTLDLDRNGRVGQGDLALLKTSFGERAARKLMFTQKMEVAEDSHMKVAADAMGRHVVVRLRLTGVPQLLGYGLGVRADPPILAFRSRVDSVAYLGGPQAALQLDHEMGDLFVFAEHVQGRQPGVSIEDELGVDLLFEMKGAPRNIELQLYEAYVSKGAGRAWSVAELGTARVLPRSYALFPNYPNPFNPSTTIPLAIPPGMAGSASLVLYNILGQPVRTWKLDQREAGFHAVTWDGEDDAGRSSGSGVYFMKLEASGFEQTGKMLLVR